MNTVMDGVATASVRECWGDNAPEWILELALQCDHTSQAVVSRRLGYSASTVNQVLHNKYAGLIDRVREKVEGAYMGVSVDCPVIGELSLDQCLDHQTRPFAATNPQRVMLFRACRNGCPYAHKGDNQ